VLSCMASKHAQMRWCICDPGSGIANRAPARSTDCTNTPTIYRRRRRRHRRHRRHCRCRCYCCNVLRARTGDRGGPSPGGDELRAGRRAVRAAGLRCREVPAFPAAAAAGVTAGRSGNHIPHTGPWWLWLWLCRVRWDNDNGHNSSQHPFLCYLCVNTAVQVPLGKYELALNR
jgi:hypothetical protein